ncbi:cell death-inducing p53-target protein 1-like [Bombyx mandarina]|uniref:Farnesoic acid O-methyltransferase n=2 Tax=Bombyx TaxID=7090 RepID=A0A8R1WEW3_BOMMO|nr:cell death-inducing p53-target protein 1 [Bombyx mori]XP_028037051.1 cell death-inducing p53-target protein 1-like [Bombyx mandarina]
MSQYSGGPPPYYPPPPAPHWPHPPPHPGAHPPPPGPYVPPNPHHPYPYYVPGTVMVPVPVPMPPMSGAPDQGQPTYITNYIYHGESSNVDQVSVVDHPGEYDWVATTATTASSLTGRAVVGGHEGWDGSPLWVIRAWHMGDMIPGKLSVRHNAASIMYNGKEIPVQNIEVLCARPEDLRWVSASNGSVPPGAVLGGRTASGETLYVGRARYQLSVTPGKVHPSHKTCYIGFGGTEVALKMYDVLCRVS